MNKINVSLYGGKSIFGGKETKLEADIIYCDHCDSCSMYKEGKCLKIRSFGGAHCKFGSKTIEEGYTSRAKKYYSWKRQFEEDPMYHKLRYPSDLYIATVDDVILINTGFITRNKETNRLVIETLMFGGGYEWVPREEFTNELLDRICKAVPRTIIDRAPVRSYQEKIIPNFLHQFRLLLPERYKEFITEFPQYADVAPNHVGKYAYVRSLRDGIELKDTRNNIFIKHGNKLICAAYNSAFLPFDGKDAQVEMEIPEKATYKITTNNEVDENTIFC